MEELLIIGLLMLLGGEESGTAGKGPDDWGYAYGEWQKVASGFARQFAWRVYKWNVDGAGVEYELAYKNPDGLHSEGNFDSESEAKARAIELGREGAA